MPRAEDLRQKSCKGTKIFENVSHKCFNRDNEGTAVWLAQLVGNQTAVRKVEGSSPGGTNTRDLKKLTEEKVLPLL